MKGFFCFLFLNKVAISHSDTSDAKQAFDALTIAVANLVHDFLLSTLILYFCQAGLISKQYFIAFFTFSLHC